MESRGVSGSRFDRPQPQKSIGVHSEVGPNLSGKTLKPSESKKGRVSRSNMGSLSYLRPFFRAFICKNRFLNLKWEASETCWGESGCHRKYVDAHPATAPAKGCHDLCAGAVPVVDRAGRNLEVGVTLVSAINHAQIRFGQTAEAAPNSIV